MAQEQGLTIAYTRVAGLAQKPDLANQIKALETYCQQQGIRVDEWMSDIASGLNYKRKQFNQRMEMIELGQVRRLLIAHRLVGWYALAMTTLKPSVSDTILNWW